MNKSGLTVVQVRKSRGGFQAEGVAKLACPDGRLEDLAPALRENLAAWGLEGCPVSLAVSSRLAFLRPAILPRAAGENLAQVVAYELDRFVPLPPEQVYYTFQVQDTTETAIHLMIMALAKDRVGNCLDLLSEAGLRPTGLTLAPLAAANAFALLGAKRLSDPWLIVYLNEGAFELTHIHHGVVKSFSQGRGPQDQAFQELKAGIDNLMSKAAAPRVLCIYGAGAGDFQVGELQQYNLDIIYPRHLGLDYSLPETDLGEALPAVGAGLSCLAKPPLRINLLPPEERAAVKVGNLSTTMTLLAVFLGLVVIWAASSLIHQRIMLYQVNREIARLTPEARQMENLLKESRDLSNQMGGMRKIGQSTDALLVLKNLTQLVPDNTWLFNLRLSKENLEISGLSQSASELIPLLDKSGWLKKTEFASPIVTDASKLDHFKIKAKIRDLASSAGEGVTGASPPGPAPFRTDGGGSGQPGHRESVLESNGKQKSGTGTSSSGSDPISSPGSQ
ncbi:MAG: PilN domain-containing protein [Thermodesulfobacteriota bacterium]